MSGVRELGLMWVKKLRTGVQNRRRDNAKMAGLCKSGGEYRKQLEMVVSAADAMLAADDMLAVLASMNRMGGDDRGGYCICPINDGSAPSHKHATICVDARAAIAKATGA